MTPATYKRRKKKLLDLIQKAEALFYGICYAPDSDLNIDGVVGNVVLDKANYDRRKWKMLREYKEKIDGLEWAIAQMHQKVVDAETLHEEVSRLAEDKADLLQELLKEKEVVV